MELKMMIVDVCIMINYTSISKQTPASI